MRFKGKNWFKTFTYNQSGFKLIDTGKRYQILHLSKIGNIPTRCHRNIDGKIKQVIIKHEASGKWFASIIEETGSKPNIKAEIKKVVGIDVGLDNIIYDSDNYFIKNPLHLKKNEAKLKSLHSKMSHRKKGSKNRAKMRIKLARQYEKITNARNDFLHKASHYYVTNYDAIGMENMIMTVKKNIFAKSRLDASWGKLRQYIAYKAESAGKLYVPVDYRGTTQICSQCATRVPKGLWNRTHKCSCGFIASRDYNSALEIKKRLIKEIGWEPSEYKLVEIPLTTELLQDISTSYASVKQEAPSL